MKEKESYKRDIKTRYKETRRNKKACNNEGEGNAVRGKDRDGSHKVRVARCRV